MKQGNAHATLLACAGGGFTQAIVCTLASLLFVTFQTEFGLDLTQLSVLVFITFGVQLLMDIVSTRLVNYVSLRVLMLIANGTSALGLVCMAFLPLWMPAYPALILSIGLYSVGSGLIEVINSPIAVSCPVENKQTMLSRLHSVFSWGQVIVVLVTTAYFALFGIANWRWLALLWAVVPFVTMIAFFFVPIYDAERSEETGAPMLSRTFFLLLMLIVAGGAAEQAIAQWASAFAETGLGISKAAGDLAGICLFAAAMGLARSFYGKFGARLDLLAVMTGGAALCIGGFLLTALSPWPALSLAGCCISGLSVGLLWPGTIALAGQRIQGNAGMYAWLALGGDIGCTFGPSAVGWVAQANGNSLRFGLTVATVFPVCALLCLLLLRKKKA